MSAFIPSSCCDSPALRTGLIFSLALAALCLSGCGTAPGPDTIYDHTPRPASAKVLVIRGDLDRPYTVIAKLNTNASASDGGDPMADLVQKAQRLGADALLLAAPKAPLKSDLSGGSTSSGYSGVDEHEIPMQTDSQGSKYVLSGWAVAYKKQ